MITIVKDANGVININGHQFIRESLKEIRPNGSKGVEIEIGSSVFDGNFNDFNIQGAVPVDKAALDTALSAVFLKPSTGGGGGGGTINGLSWTAATLGLVADGATDQTAALNTLLASANVDTVFFETKGNYLINGTVNGNNKTLKFANGAKITGTGTFNNFNLVAESQMQNIFAVSITLNCNSTPDGKFSVHWHGAKADGSNDQPAIQKTIDDILNNYSFASGYSSNITTVTFPANSYLCSKGILARKKNQTNTGFVSISLSFEGNENSFDHARAGGGTILNFSDATDFCFGIQQGKGCTVKNLQIAGNNHAPDSYTMKQICNPLDASITFIGAGVRSNRTTPHAGFICDPFGSSATAAGNQYPNWPAEYISNINSGSTGIHFENCKVNNVVVGFAIGINGSFQNCENISLERCWCDYVHTGVATGNSQTRTVSMHDFCCWGQTMYVVNSADFGEGVGITPEWNLGNIAGGVRYLYKQGGGIQYAKFSNLKAELLWSLGGRFDDTSHSAKFMHCEFDFFTNHDEDGNGLSRLPQIYLQANDVTFLNCYLWHYGLAISRINISAKIVNFFGGNATAPIGNNPAGGAVKQYGLFANGQVFAENDNIDGINGDSGQFTLAGTRANIFVLSNTVNFTELIKRSLLGKAEYAVGSGGSSVIAINEAAATWTFDAGGNAAAMRAGDYVALNYHVNETLLYPNLAGQYNELHVGTISGIAGNIITVHGLPIGLAAAQNIDYAVYRFYTWKPLHIGTTAAFGNTISGIIKERQDGFSLAVGDIIFHPTYTGGFAVLTGVNAGAGTATTDRTATTSGQIELTTYPYKGEKVGELKNGEGYKTGDLLYSSTGLKYCTVSGIVGKALAPTFVTL